MFRITNKYYKTIMNDFYKYTSFYILILLVLFDFSSLNTPRLKKELGQLLNKPPFGMKVNVKEGSTSVLEAGKSLILLLKRKKNHWYIKMRVYFNFMFNCFRNPWTKRFSI